MFNNGEIAGNISVVFNDDGNGTRRLILVCNEDSSTQSI